MLGVLVTVVFSLGAMGVGSWMLRRVVPDRDPALRLGISGLLGLGGFGYLSLGVLAISGGPSWGMGLMWVLATAGLGLLWREYRGVPKFRLPQFRLPQGVVAVFPAAIAILAVIALVSVIAPSDISDWDTLSYHLGVPKLWIHAGHSYSVPALHQSNFPAGVDNLYVWGLQWGGESGAKAFEWVFYLLGTLALFGFARERYGASGAEAKPALTNPGLAGWWTALIFASIPVAAWEAGSAYIDVAHGLFAGFSILFAALFVKEPDGKGNLILSCAFLGLAAACKYTGLETAVALATVVFAAFAVRRQVLKGLAHGVAIGLAALVIALPSLLVNVHNLGNPVYPFLYAQFGGKNWDARRAFIYQREQNGFGVGRNLDTQKLDPSAIGHSVLGLAYNPGRYVNPGEQAGLGSPLGAVGAIVIVAMMVWLISGVATAFEGVVLGTVLLGFLIWFVMSEQSRYAITFAIPLSVLAAGAIVRLRVGQLLAVAAVVQAMVSAYLLYAFRFVQQLPVVLGQVSAEDYQLKYSGFYGMAQKINVDAKGGKVALYNETFGFFLDVPYMWANPGHSTLIPYDSEYTAADYVRDMKALGFSHVYLNLSGLVEPDRPLVGRMLSGMGIGDPSAGGLTADDRTGMLGNWELKWKVLLVDAVAQHLMSPVDSLKSGILFKLN